MRNRFLNSWGVGVIGLVLSLTSGCEDDPVVEVNANLPPLAAPTYGDGHLSPAQRGIPFDEDDLAVIPGTGSSGISAEEIDEHFGLVVLNRPYVDWRITRCPNPNEAVTTKPWARSEEILTALSDLMVTSERIAVNVDLLTPGRRALLYVCFESGAPVGRFDVPEHRAAVIETFVEIASQPNVAYITVGLEMNRYYHLRDDEGRTLFDDYSNYISLYREVYEAIKETNPEVKVGPGISWAVFRNQTMPHIAEELGRGSAADPEILDTLVGVNGHEIAFRAYVRTVQPLLVTGRGESKRITADFIGVTMQPFHRDPPFNGTPAPDDAADFNKILDYYRWLAILTVDATPEHPIPFVLPQIDWAERRAGSKKNGFLQTLKYAMSGLDIEWASWRRLSDLPTTPLDASKCKQYTGAPDPALAYSQDYCTGGMLESSGVRRSVYDTFITD
jgi:hypothetical protein